MSIFDEEPNLPRDWPCCENCAKTRGKDCSRTKVSGRVQCRAFKRKTSDNNSIEGKKQ
jgi:hypothetical protein